MTIAAIIPTRHNFVGNGVATSFSYAVKIRDKSHIKLVHTNSSGGENTLVVDVDYTVNGVDAVGGGTVDFPKAGSLYSTLATGEKLSILYVFPIEQTTDIPNTGRVFNETIEDQLDYITVLINQHEEKFNRSLKLLKGSTLIDIDFPEGISAANRATKGSRWNSAGTALEMITLTPGANIDPIAVKGDIIQGDAVGNADKLAIGAQGAILNVVSGLLAYLPIGAAGDILSVVSGLLAYDKPWGICWKKGADVASLSALIVGDDGNYFDVTGTTGITSINTIGVGGLIRLHFDGALTLTHHATDLVLPGGNNITTIAGDEATFIEYATGDWRLVGYAGTMPISNFSNANHDHSNAAGGGYTLGFIQRVKDTTSTAAIGGVVTGTTVIPDDDTIPVNTEGDLYLTVTITPNNTANILTIEVVLYMANNGSTSCMGALFQDSTVNALSSCYSQGTGGGEIRSLVLKYEMVAGTTSATTFNFRAGGGAAGTTTVNGLSAARNTARSFKVLYESN